MAKPSIGLDNPVLAGRMRNDYRRPIYRARSTQPVRPRVISDVRVVTSAKPLSQTPAANQVSAPPTSLPVQTPPARHAPPAAPRPKITHERRDPKRKISANNVLTVLAIALIAGGALVGWYSLRTNREVATQAQQLAQKNDDTEESTVPSEAKPAATNYQVAPDLPRYIDIPKLGTHARVLRLGVTSTNQLKAPPNIFDAGWYDGSAKPGEAGATVIDGHLSGPTQNGVFYGLKTLKPGDLVKIERGDGKVLTYKVVTSKTYAADKVDMAAALTPITPGKSGLNLITCAGDLDASRIHFDERTVVFASQI